MGGKASKPHHQSCAKKATQHAKKHLLIKRRSLSNLASNVSGLTNSIASNISSNLTGRQQPHQQLPSQNTNNTNLPSEVTRRASADTRVDAKEASTITMNHLLRGKTALSTKTKRPVARGLIAVPPEALSKVPQVFHNEFMSFWKLLIMSTGHQLV